MIGLMIVDDESTIRKGIEISIDWSMYNIKIVGEAGNGREALSKALKIRPDIVITDIRMPIMDGLELAQNLKIQLPDTKIVILSGYNDFDYAKKAINIGVSEYLLKPVGADELVKLVIRLKDQIIIENRKRENDISAQVLFNESLPLIQARFIWPLLKGEVGEESSIVGKSDLLKMDMSGPSYQVILIDIDDYLLITEQYSSKNKDLLKYSVQNIADEILSSGHNGHVYYSEFDYLVGIVNIKNENENEPGIINDCKEIQFCITRYLKLSVTISIGKVYRGLDGISQSYNEALIAIRNKMFIGKNKIIHIDTVSKPKHSSPLLYTSENEKELYNCLRIMNFEKLNEIISMVFSDLTKSDASYNHIKNTCLRLILISTSVLEEMGINIEKAVGDDFQPDIEIKKYETIENIEGWMKSLFKKFVSAIKENKSAKYKSIVKVAMQYVNEHYSENISLFDIASNVYVTPNYFSKVFKQETGENFVEWLNQFRIEKAKFLLKDISTKTYEIAEKVGYNDYKYFSYNFKKYTGYSPREFKELKT